MLSNCNIVAHYLGLHTRLALLMQGEGLVKLALCNDIHRRVEEWHIFSVQMWEKYCQDCLIPSAQSLIGLLAAIGNALAIFRQCATPPHMHPTSRYVTACDKFYQS